MAAVQAVTLSSSSLLLNVKLAKLVKIFAWNAFLRVKNSLSIRKLIGMSLFKTTLMFWSLIGQHPKVSTSLYSCFDFFLLFFLPNELDIFLQVFGTKLGLKMKTCVGKIVTIEYNDLYKIIICAYISLLNFF